MQPIQPYHQFKVSVAEELNSNFGWCRSGINLVDKQDQVVDDCWQHNQNPVEAALAVHRMQMNRSQKIKYVSPITLALNYNKKTGELE